jgi:flagellar protein FliL
MKLLGILVPVIALAAGVGVGAGAALFLKPAEAPPEEEAVEPEPTPFEPPVPGQTAEFAQLGNQFVVPVVRGGAVRALVLVSVTLEVSEGGSAAVHSLEPRLRDAFLQVLFDHANTGGFDDRFTQNDRMSLLRQGLREAAHRLLGPVLRDVLIVDIVRQET